MASPRENSRRALIRREHPLPFLEIRSRDDNTDLAAFHFTDFETTNLLSGPCGTGSGGEIESPTVEGAQHLPSPNDPVG